MKKNISPAEAYTDLDELDQLVTQEINVLQKKNRRTTLVRKHQKTKPLFSDNVVLQEDLSADDISYENAMDSQQSDLPNHSEKYEDDQEDVIEPDDPHQFEQKPEVELFTEMELAFITRTSDWLKPRENKDLIMNRIWEQLTDTIPESFYSVETEDHPEIETSHIEEDSGANAPESSS